MKKLIYIVLAVLVIGALNYNPISNAINKEYKALVLEYAAQEYNLSANPLSTYDDFSIVRPVPDDQELTTESGAGRIMSVNTSTSSLCVSGTGQVVELWTRLDVTLDDGCYYAYRETEFIFNEGDNDILMVGDEISFDYHVDSNGERVLDQVIDARDPDTVLNRSVERKARLKADKNHAAVSVVLRALPIALIEIGILVGLYFISKFFKSNPDNSWKKVYANSSLMSYFSLSLLMYMTIVQQYICQPGSSVLCALKDSVLPSISINIVLVPIFAVIALVIYIIIAAKKKEGFIAGLFVFIILSAIIGISLFVSIKSYVNRARNAASSVNAHAPIIYLYNENDEDEMINVSLDLDGELDVTYPLYDESCGWNVTATSDGVLEDEVGNIYPFLFWEATLNMDYDLSCGFCVKGCDTESFLNEALAELGLNEKEAADFMSYWLPLMEGNEYNVITFQTTAYEDAAGLIVNPSPDVTVRINMLWYATSEYVELESQNLEDMNPSLTDRFGLTLVEWGGEVIDEPA